MDRLFLDANVLFSAAYKIDARILQLWKLRNVALCSSHYALQEARINLAEEDQQIRLGEREDGRGNCDCPSRRVLEGPRGINAGEEKSLHRQLQAFLLRKFLRLIVSRVSMADDPHPRIGRQHALDAFSHHLCSVGNGDLAGVQ